MGDLIKMLIPGVHREGYVFVFIGIACSFMSFVLSESLGWISLLLTVGIMFFFRDPDRVTPEGCALVISPGDGIIQKISLVHAPKMMIKTKGEVWRVSIFLSVFDVHVNRIPVSGLIKDMHYYPGKFFNASFDKASEHNERQGVLIETESNYEICMFQIAGLIARRIVCELKKDQKVVAGERFGIIRFGSRMDLYLPRTTVIQVLEGQRVIGGETVIGMLTDNAVINLNRPVVDTSAGKVFVTQCNMSEHATDITLSDSIDSAENKVVKHDDI